MSEGVAVASLEKSREALCSGGMEVELEGSKSERLCQSQDVEEEGLASLGSPRGIEKRRPAEADLEVRRDEPGRLAADSSQKPSGT